MGVSDKRPNVHFGVEYPFNILIHIYIHPTHFLGDDFFMIPPCHNESLPLSNESYANENYYFL